MLLDGSVYGDENDRTLRDTCDGRDWREIDGALQRIGKQRAALDAEEAGWLVRAARVQIWRKLGFVSLLDYLERRCDYAPRTARDRIRVAFELEGLPGLTAALATGQLGFSSVKELVRVVTPEHEAEWLDKARNKTCFEIQKLVAGRKKGSRPSDAPDPDLETRTLRFEDILPTTIARLRQARAKAQDERGERLSDDALLSMLCGMFLEGAPTAEGSGRAKYQIATVTVCEKCNQGWQDGAGAKYAMAPAELARAECDAQRIGSLDTNRPTRAKQDIPPSVRRLVWRRDGGKCTIPSCRSAAYLELHHIVAREDGGTHDASNI
ncbi:MAG: HNH endonuclease, partial [Deltaproteobacteria bacterium]|nr:HNH endonuclease [Deltaproteobacteria bacterium]